MIPALICPPPAGPDSMVSHMINLNLDSEESGADSSLYEDAAEEAEADGSPCAMATPTESEQVRSPPSGIHIRRRSLGAAGHER